MFDNRFVYNAKQVSEKQIVMCILTSSLLIPFSDNTLLLQPFCTKAQFLSGKAKLDLIDRVAGTFRMLIVAGEQFCMFHRFVTL